jgi:hypothetical protein
MAGKAELAYSLQRGRRGVANKLARMAWAVLASGEAYRPPCGVPMTI